MERYSGLAIRAWSAVKRLFLIRAAIIFPSVQDVGNDPTAVPVRRPLEQGRSVGWRDNDGNLAWLAI